MAVLATLLCGPASLAQEASSGPREIVLVTLDTTRSDYVGAYGRAGARTPVLDSLAARGVRYALALTPSPLTLPAHCSLLTGLEPPEHGVRDNGIAALPSDLPTLQGALSARGWATGAFVASMVLDRRFGLSRGFDLYDDQMTAERIGIYGYPERAADVVTAAALAWADRQARAEPTRPRFVWVHYYDPHAPYLPPEGFGGDGEQEAYAGEIAWVDSQLGRLLEGLPGPAASRLVAVVGDHGEMLGEHGERAHGLFVYRAALEVPLILQGPKVPSGAVVERAVSTRRLMPTLLSLAGLEVPDGAGDPLPLRDTDERTETAVYSETLMPATAYGWSPLHAVSDDRWRLIKAPRPELYDHRADPAETRNLVQEEREVARRLRDRLVAVTEKEREPATITADPEIAAGLRSLGYLSGASLGPGGPAEGGLDPKDGVELLDRFYAGKRYMADGEVRRALSEFEGLVEASPSSVPFLTNLSRAQMGLGRLEEAAATMERALRLNPGLDFLHHGLGEVRARLGRYEAAREAYEAALKLNPRMSLAWLGLAELEFRRGNSAREREVLLSAVDAGANSAGVLARLAHMALAANQLPTAEGYLREADRLTPEWVSLSLLWAQLEERRGDSRRALEHYRRYLEQNDQDPMALFRAGRLALALGEDVEGRLLLERAAARSPGTEIASEARRLLSASDGGS